MENKEEEKQQSVQIQNDDNQNKQQQDSDIILLNEKCELEGHQYYDLVAICLDEECQATKRLACSKCLILFHGEHTNACLFLEDIKDPKQLALKAWSKDNLGKQVEQYLRENENIEKEIDNMMDKLLEDIIDETNKAKNVMRRKRVEGKTEVQKTAKKIQQKYEAAYDIQHIRQLLVGYMEEKMSEEQLNEKLEEIIKAREEIEELNRKNKLVATYPVIDKEFLIEKQESLLDLINSLSNTIRIPNAWTFIKSKSGNNHQIKEIITGKQFEFNDNQMHQILYGTEVMKEGVHSWVIRIEMVKKKDDEEEKKEDAQQNQDQEPVQQGGFGQGNFEFGGGFGAQGAFGAQVNFNHADYHVIRNLYIGVINEKKKDNQQSYAKGFGQNSGQDAHGLDIVRNQIVGGYLFQSGSATKMMSQVFWEKRTKYVEIHFTLDLDQQKVLIKDKDGESQYEANFQGMFKGIAWRPYICSMRSKLRVELASSLNS